MKKTVHIEDEQHFKLKEYALNSGMTVRELIAEMIEYCFDYRLDGFEVYLSNVKNKFKKR